MSNAKSNVSPVASEPLSQTGVASELVAVWAAPLALLKSIPGLTLVPLEDSDQCCGAAGIYNLIEPDVSDRVLAPKLQRIADTKAQVVATGNPGCMMQIGAGLILSGSSARVRHPVELLAESYD